jgi:hypothetical protein
MRSLLITAALALAATGCASSGGFKQLYPGMTSAQVAETMGRGPTRAQEFADGSSAWYFGEDRCVLMRDDKIVSKATTEENASVDTPLVTVRDTSKALCVPPGYAVQGKSQQEIDTPFGTFKGNIDPAAISNKVKSAVKGEEAPKQAPAQQATQPTP